MSTLFAYAAGMLDSDGSITLHKNHASRKNPHYKVTVQLTWSKTELTTKAMEEFIVHFGGKLYDVKRNLGYATKVKVMNKWLLYKTEDTLLFLRGIYPYLKLKKEQARLSIEFLERRANTPVKYGFANPKPKEVVEYEMSAYSLMRELNTKNKGSVFA